MWPGPVPPHQQRGLTLPEIMESTDVDALKGDIYKAIEQNV